MEIKNNNDLQKALSRSKITKAKHTQVQEMMHLAGKIQDAARYSGSYMSAEESRKQAKAQLKWIDD